jgi:small-conductance mechanosensitive channel
MKELRRLWIVVPAMVLAVLAILLYIERGTMEQLAFMRRGGGAETGLVDRTPYQTAQTLAAMAVSAEEQAYAQEALREAGHEVDQAFAMALREASLRQKTMSGNAAASAAKVEALKTQVKQDQAQVETLTAAAAKSGTAPAEGDDLDVAKAQLQLDTDELTDATGDLARETNDQRARIQQELAAHESDMKKLEAGNEKKATAVAAVRQHATLWGRVSAWFEQRTRARLLAQAEAKAQDDAKAMAARHDRMEDASVKASGQVAATSGSARVKMLESMATRRAAMSISDDRAQTDQQLASVYGSWQQQVWTQHRILGYLIIESLALVTFLILATMLAILAGRALVSRLAPDPRRRHTLRTVLTLALELVGALAILLVVLGVPQQLTTILGLMTAGLTVVFQDFILAFFGWFVLMGRNGIRVSDWVEIDGVGGEVAEIGLFRTVLLEAGNWTERGHPTGRRVTFTNSFAIRGQYFNFTTHGQWMWDEIQLNVPATGNAYALISRMQDAVAKATLRDTEQAEREWKKATSEIGLSQFSARPTVDLRPASSGVDVIVRFVTRASDRFGQRKLIYEALVGMMEGTERTELGDGAVESPHH